MTPSYQSTVRVGEHKPQLDGLRRWAMANVEILQLVWAKFEAQDDWPNAKLLQCELFSEGERFDANVFSREIPAMLGRLDLSSQKITLTPRGLSFVPAARPVLDSMATLVQLAVERYADPAGEPVISSAEFEGLLGIDQQRARQLVEILLNDSWLFRPAGGSVNEGQAFAIDETAVLHVLDVHNIEDYLDVQAAVWYSVPRAGEIAIPLLDPAPDPTEPKVDQTTTPQPLAVPDALRGLHPVVLGACTPLWVTGHRQAAINRAAVAVVNAVRELAALPDHYDGQDLMSRAFNPDKPLIVVGDLTTRLGENLQRGTHFIAMGAMASIRNIASHTLREPSPEDARDQLAVLSLIARRLDAAREMKPSTAAADVP